ncbi:hypothetical protein [Pseudomonas sp. RIT-PI-q]|uniref:hypothetical protein n=1 Tax=Pseudomonas sp. RIT-PI-q TaxID=1690247 RepID=UPI00128EE8C8|nr:hypothetical protein [Pseudomonas sp. RIT-PI-q]
MTVNPLDAQEVAGWDLRNALCHGWTPGYEALQPGAQEVAGDAQVLAHIQGDLLRKSLQQQRKTSQTTDLYSFNRLWHEP